MLLLLQNRNAVCGEHKDEMLHQLRELAKLEPNSDNGDEGDIERLIEFQPLVPQHNVQPQDTCADFEHNSKQGIHPQYEVYWPSFPLRRY